MTPPPEPGTRIASDADGEETRARNRRAPRVGDLGGDPCVSIRSYSARRCPAPRSPAHRCAPVHGRVATPDQHPVSTQKEGLLFAP